MIDWVDVNDSSEIEDRRCGRALSAPRRGIRSRTCWQTTSDGMNLGNGISR